MAARRRSLAGAAAALGCLLLGLLSCVEDRSNLVQDQTCSAGLRWAGLEQVTGLSQADLEQRRHRRGFEMHPGRDCISCHRASSQGKPPSFSIAGTVFFRLAEADDCLGVGGASISITDANNKVYSLQSNNAGNFFLRTADAPDFKPPFEAKITYQGRTGVMYPAQSLGSCNACHTPKGADPTGGGYPPPGRICVDPKDSSCMPGGS
jgi:mono/diheme cytochrome c family protein